MSFGTDVRPRRASCSIELMTGHASFARRTPAYIHRLAGGKKLRYVARVWPRGVIRAPPRNVICPLMNLPLYSPTAPAAGWNRGYGKYALAVHCQTSLSRACNVPGGNDVAACSH